MATIYNNVDKVAGDPQAVSIKVELVWDTDDSPVARDVANFTMIQGYVEIDSDENGAWELSLVANDDILPADNAYKITETVKSTGVKSSYYISIADSATPNYWVGSVIISEPVWV